MRGRSPWLSIRHAPRELAGELRRDVETLCAVGERSIARPEALAAAASFIEGELGAALPVERQHYALSSFAASADNVIATVEGSSPDAGTVVVGAHYDTVPGCAGADDNASGVAALLAIARRVAKRRPSRTIRFAAFACEEPPHFQTRDMGSWQYARLCHQRHESITAMLSLEMLGCYSSEKRSQQYPVPLSPLYPSTANFIAFVGNLGSRGVVQRSAKTFRAHSAVPVETASLPEIVPGIAWSDQWSFWQFGWAALMVTDTALYRNPRYHTAGDLPDTLDYDSMAEVVEGLVAVVAEEARRD